VKFAQVKSLRDSAFRRLTGIKRKTFDKMIEVLTAEEQKKKAQGGRPNDLSIEDRILMALEYLREYRTYFHISQSYGVSESACYRNIRWVEDTLIKCKVFSLPGRKALLKSDVEYEMILVDATESPIERPQKNKNFSIPEKRKNTP
jgi:Helix-turn-helix of DDE superfamily endonuclease